MFKNSQLVKSLFWLVKGIIFDVNNNSLGNKQ